MRSLILTALVCWSTSLPLSVLAEEGSSPTKVESPAPDLSLPAVFEKRDPETVADLRQMQAHLMSMSSLVGKCVVGIQIGGAQGSGVIVSKDGYILTAGHVSGPPGRRARVILPSGEVVDGTTLGRNRVADVGIVKINGERENWPFVPMAAGDSIDAGEWCLVMGHPGGYIRDRPAPLRFGRVLGKYKNTIQTDCELVGGDSGGPVFDMEGKVIGINSRIGPETAMNFHADISVFHHDWSQLVASEDLQGHSGAFLGVTGEKSDEGLRVTIVHEKSPAERAGIKVGDIITTFQSKKVDSLDRLVDLVGLEPPRRRIKMQLLRDGKVTDLELTLGEL